jgi:DNA-directed RNA polymerase subunit RPC12/RpoP
MANTWYECSNCRYTEINIKKTHTCKICGEKVTFEWEEEGDEDESDD